ncbi:MAG TPA: prolyl oligopeptidase family serine peptidase [Planctomycetota bacterium]|nr:prolyl oligopeptidase family serine peptidase [Planctomycetota bacterium]
MFRRLVLALFCCVTSLAAADVPPKGVPVPPEIKAELEKGAASLGKEIDALKSDLKDKPKLLELLPDIEIFHNAVRFALEDDLFYENAKTKKVGDFDIAKKLLALGEERAKQLRAGQTPWTLQTGAVVRGYRSELDGTSIPYGLIVPAKYEPRPQGSGHRLDFWFMGRNEKNSELAFINGRLNGKAEFPTENGFELHPYGRYCNAYKFAGEMDALESMNHVCAHYSIDSHKISVRGFSMGGAATWHLGAHLAGQWAAVNPGAGFTDVRTYQHLDGKLNTIPWYEQKLWHLYDAVDYAINLTNTTLVAYSGEIDSQKAAADLMEKTLAAEHIKMTHIIGPKTGHAYEPNAKKEVAKLVSAAADKGLDPLPREIHFTTWTLKYNTMHWITIEALEKHWERARIDATLGANSITLKTSNVAALVLTPDISNSDAPVKISIDGMELSGAPPNQKKSWHIALFKKDGKWEQDGMPATSRLEAGAPLRKRHDLQGPIDDAFMESFMMVRPTGKPLSEKIGKWTQSEMNDALTQWRKQMRGEARVKYDADVSEADIAAHNLILWGDPQSNKILAKIADKLPIKWSAQNVTVGAKNFPANECVPLLIYPNPLNPKKYVVLNSGFTFARFGAASNSQQTPKLPDWAIVSMDVPAAERLTQGVKDAGFLGEQWELKSELNR